MQLTKEDLEKIVALLPVDFDMQAALTSTIHEERSITRILVEATWQVAQERFQHNAHVSAVPLHLLSEGDTDVLKKVGDK